ncbi:hypothetical protein BH09MYX1_BH09MYX1_34720 [soil metagenome]
MRKYLRTLLATVAAVSASGSAWASNVTEFPDNGSEQMARGGAWVARASDPLATFYNPAGLAGQDTKLTLQANFAVRSSCFNRIAATNDTSLDPLRGANGAYPEACNDFGVGVGPQLAATFKVTDRFGVGIAILAPSGVANNSWPEFVNDSKGTPRAAPQRYMLLSGNALVLNPSIGVGWEPTDRLRIGASFQWGIASVKFANASGAVNGDALDPSTNDVKATLSVKDFFVPGFTLGALWSPSDNVDLAGWFKWSAPIEASGDVTTGVNYFRPAVAQNGPDAKVVNGDSSATDCGTGNPGVAVCKPDLGTLKLPVPMEAKIGVRVRGARGDVGQKHRRDPMSQDIWDVEVDFTFANNKTMDNLEVRFPGNPDGSGVIPVNGISGGTLPPNADVPHYYKNVFGVRLGGEWNAIKDRLAIRAGGFFESNGQDAQYQNIDFMGGQRIGLSLGGTVRIPVSKTVIDGASRGSAIELSLGFMHMFVSDQTNTDPNSAGVKGLVGSACNPAGPTTNGNCPNGNQPYRSNWAVNLGTITNALNVFNVGASYRF